MIVAEEANVWVLTASGSLGRFQFFYMIGFEILSASCFRSGKARSHISGM